MAENPYNAILDKINKDIEKSGFSVMAIASDGESPPFCYTVGLFETYGVPEITLVGLRPEMAHMLITDVVDRYIKEHHTLPLGVPVVDIIKNMPAIFLEIDDPINDASMYFVRNYYSDKQTAVPAVQFVWPDADKRFPWEPGFNESMRRYQPIYGNTPDKVKPTLHLS